MHRHHRSPKCVAGPSLSTPHRQNHLGNAATTFTCKQANVATATLNAGIGDQQADTQARAARMAADRIRIRAQARPTIEDMQHVTPIDDLAIERDRLLAAGRPEERRVGKECVSTVRSRWYP